MSLNLGEMQEIAHQLDPDGDTILVLRNANAPFAIWHDENNWPDALISRFEAPASPNVVFTDTVEEISAPGTATAQSGQASTPATPATPATPETPVVPEIRMKLSSRHLILASKYFKSMLQGPWKESSIDSGFQYRIHADDWDEEALLILMNIIHGHTTKVPRQLNLEVLARIAVLIDYYQCHEIIELFSDIWLPNLAAETLVPEVYGRDLVLRFLVSWVFADEQTFAILARFVLREGRGSLHTLELPIPDAVVEKIEQQRQKLVQCIVSRIGEVFTMLCKGKLGCNKECSAILMGALTKQMLPANLLLPQPNAPFLGYSFDAIITRITEIEQPKWKDCAQAMSDTQQHQKSYVEGFETGFRKGWEFDTYNRRLDREMSQLVKSIQYPESWSVNKMHPCLLHKFFVDTIRNARASLCAPKLSDFGPPQDVGVVKDQRPPRGKTWSIRLPGKNSRQKL